MKVTKNGSVLAMSRANAKPEGRDELDLIDGKYVQKNRSITGAILNV